MTEQQDHSQRTSQPLPWLSLFRGVAMSWIFLTHAVERIYCCPLFGNPTSAWPELGERFAQLKVLDLAGVSGLLMNVIRYLGWSGDIGVQMFIAASGFGLTWSVLRSSRTTREFYARRLFRIVPLWVVAHLFAMGLWFFGAGMDPFRKFTWASLAGLRMFPQVMYYFAPAWWFIGLIVQLYVVFPWLSKLLQKWGPRKFFWTFLVGSCVLRLLGLLCFELYLPLALDWWSRGALFVSRLPEFTFGMLLAAVWTRSPATTLKRLRAWKTRSIAGAAFLIGLLALFSLPGLAVAMLLTGGSLLVLFAGSSLRATGLARPFAWLGNNSLGFFLVHHSIIIALIEEEPMSLGRFLTLALVALLLSLVLGLLFEKTTSRLIHALGISVSPLVVTNPKRTLLRVGITVPLLVGVLLLGEWSVRKYAPREVLGWGERPALLKDERYAFRLKPDRSTRLRWLSYDYLVEANELGFPGPHFTAEEHPDAYRVLVTGDAFESAEGVDTDKSWPRLLPRHLQRKQPVVVSNFSITGWGPNQYSQVIAEHLESHEPHLIVVGFFVNDFWDVQSKNEDFQRSIGFHRRSVSHYKSVMKFPHLRSFLTELVERPLLHAHGKLTKDEHFFGYFEGLETRSVPTMEAGVPLIAERFREIADQAKRIEARLLVVLVPAPAQVCRREDVEWWPDFLDLNEPEYDLEQPQRLMQKVCQRAKVECLDLRPALRDAAPSRPCQASNLHLTEAGHAALAKNIGAELSK